MPDFLKDLVALLIPVVVAGLTTWGWSYVKKGIAWVDALPAGVQQVAVTVIVYLLTALASAIGVQMEITDLNQLTQGQFQELLSVGLAFLFHNTKTTKAARVEAAAAKALAAEAANKGNGG